MNSVSEVAANADEAAVPSLPQEVVRSICLAVDTASALSTILSCCHHWRDAVDEEAWKRVTLRRFPSVSILVEALPIERPCYRSIYRDQALAIIDHRPETSLSTINDRLKRFVFTIELVVGKEKTSWSGLMRAGSCAGTVVDCVGCRLWEPGQAPSWAVALLDASRDLTHDAYQSHCALLASSLRMAMRVSKVSASGTSTSTLCLADALAPDADACTARQLGFGYVGEFFDALPRLSFASLECLRVFSGREEIQQDLDGPRIRPWLDVATGIVDGIFCTSAHPDNYVKPESVADYFERFAPW